MPLTDTVLAEAERLARAALRAEPPTLTAQAPNRYALEARPEVLDFIRDVGPPVVLKLLEEVRRLRADQERLFERLRNVESWNAET